MTGTECGAPAPLSEALLDQAIDWLLRVNDDSSGAAEAACRRWRAAHPEHERAWQGVTAVGAQLRGSMSGMAPQAATQVLHRVAAGQDRRATLKMLMLGGAAVVGGGAVWRSSEHWPVWAAQYRTGTGQSRELQLADGATIWLNTQTALDIETSDAGHVLRLHRGEILVQTAATANKMALQVQTPAGVLTPLGTRFLVRVYDDPAHTRLTVLQAQVRVVAPTLAQPLVLSAGQQLDFGPGASQQIEPAQGDAAAWHKQMLAVSRMRLDTFVAELSRYRPGRIQCAPEVAALTVTGAFPLADTDRILAALAQDLPIRVQAWSRYWLRILPN